MQYQRSYKLGRNPPPAEPLHNSHTKMRRSLKGSLLSDKKDQHREHSRVNNSRKDYSFTDQKTSQQGKRLRLRTEPSRNASEAARDNLNIKAFKPADEDSKGTSTDKLNRMFVIRTQPQPTGLKVAPARRPSQLPAINSSKVSSKEYGVVKTYAANTHCGLYRKYNEDRISISLNVEKERSIHCVGVFDGHGGASCSEFLSNNIFDMVPILVIQFIEKEKVLKNVEASLKETFKEVERRFLEQARTHTPVDKSGSCALIAVVVDDTVYVCNLGDSRAVLIDQGRHVQLTQDHKPSLPCQKERIQRLGGKLYQTKFSLSTTGESEMGPCRVWPGRLSVSRTIGDIEAKDSEMGGIQGVVSCEPDIRSFKVIPGSILILACDGIYDRLSNADLAKIFSLDHLERAGRTLHQLTGEMVDECIREAMIRDSYDNLSAISVMF